MDDEETEVCWNCGGKIVQGTVHWLHQHRTRETIYCRDADFRPLKPLQRAKPALWTDAE